MCSCMGNNGYPIAKWSENPIESWNKHVCAYRSGPAIRARQCSNKSNISDIFRRMLIQSHPKIASKSGKNGHTPRSSIHKRDYDVKNEEEMIVSLLYTEVKHYGFNFSSIYFQLLFNLFKIFILHRSNTFKI